jgi:CHAT domain-containing protein
MGLVCIEPGRTRQQVSLALEGCKIFHFAGHGYTDKDNPLQSHLLLKDHGKKNPDGEKSPRNQS